jgi:uncharacterized protein
MNWYPPILGKHLSTKEDEIIVLTKKELLKYKKQKEKLVPVFIDTQNSLLLEFTESLLEIVSQSLRKTQKQIEEEMNHILCAFEVEQILAQGLKKLCCDLLTFESVLSEKTIEFRHKVFQTSFQYLSTTNCLNQYRKLVVEHVDSALLPPGTVLHGAGDNTIESYLYSDLPEFHKVTEVKSLSPTQLLNKYNVSLVQGLLFHCGKLKITLTSISQYKAQLRQLLKQIKFFQLVAHFEKFDDKIEIFIDGPHSLFEQTHKYGFNLACFFPALVLMPQWELEAEIELGKQSRQSGILKLSHKNNLQSHYKNYSAYIPEEFKLFAESFRNQAPPHWKLTEECENILFDGDNYFFPDFLFIHSSGKEVYLELFHSWHSAALKHRLLASSKKSPSFNLIVGVSKSILKDSLLNEELKNSSYFKDFSFEFRDVIPAGKVIEKLASFEVK